MTTTIAFRISGRTRPATPWPRWKGCCGSPNRSTRDRPPLSSGWTSSWLEASCAPRSGISQRSTSIAATPAPTRAKRCSGSWRSSSRISRRSRSGWRRPRRDGGHSRIPATGREDVQEGAARLDGACPSRVHRRAGLAYRGSGPSGRGKGIVACELQGRSRPRGRGLRGLSDHLEMDLRIADFGPLRRPGRSAGLYLREGHFLDTAPTRLPAMPKPSWPRPGGIPRGSRRGLWSRDSGAGDGHTLAPSSFGGGVLPALSGHLGRGAGDGRGRGLVSWPDSPSATSRDRPGPGLRLPISTSSSTAPRPPLTGPRSTTTW